MEILKRALKEALPPITIKAARYVVNFKRRRSLFEGDDSLFKYIVPNCRLYGEYGCGQSTQWVLRNTTCSVVAIDSDKSWLASIDPDSAYEKRLTRRWVDCGELRGWGQPLSYSHRNNFSDYTDWMWNRSDKPSVVLIDGRFRVCCFLTTLKYADEGTKVLFDDYTNRPEYHIVEEFVKPSAVCGRQRLFVVPAKSKLDSCELDKNIHQFRYVID